VRRYIIIFSNNVKHAKKLKRGYAIRGLAHYVADVGERFCKREDVIDDAQYKVDILKQNILHNDTVSGYKIDGFVCDNNKCDYVSDTDTDTVIDELSDYETDDTVSDMSYQSDYETDNS
jgi:hypothetical protein